MSLAGGHYYDRLGRPKQHTSITSQFLWVRSLGTAEPGPLLRISLGGRRDAGSAGASPEPQLGSAPNACGCWPVSIPCGLLAAGPMSLLAGATLELLPRGPLYSGSMTASKGGSSSARSPSASQGELEAVAVSLQGQLATCRLWATAQG